MTAEQVAAWASTHPSCTQCGAPVSGCPHIITSGTTSWCSLSQKTAIHAQLADELAAALRHLMTFSRGYTFDELAGEAPAGESATAILARYDSLTAPSEAT